MRILVVDDEEIQRVTIQDDLRDMGYDVTALAAPLPSLELLRKEKYDVVLTDLKMPGMNGIEFLKEIKKIDENIEVLIMTAYATVKTAVDAIRCGAYDYLTKPFELDELLQILAHLGKLKKLTRENIQLRRQLEERRSFGNIIGKSAVMQKVFEQLEVVSPTDTTVLITGETGAGKEIVAETIHYNSHRSTGPLIKVNCAILSRDILESELFGHTKGSFTGAQNDKKGRFELAAKGTIYLDDVDDIPLDLQVKLLRVLQEKEIERVGDAKTIPVDVRVIASTKNDLYTLSKKGTFRSDLYYRLNVFPINLPPLRERKEDIPLLLEHFLKSFNQDKVPVIDGQTLSILLDLPWEGNVRELKNLAERLSVNCRCNPIVPECLPVEMLEEHNQHYFPLKTKELGSSLPEKMERFEKELLKEAITATAGNREKAAKILGIPVSTLKSKLKKHKFYE